MVVPSYPFSDYAIGGCHFEELTSHATIIAWLVELVKYFFWSHTGLYQSVLQPNHGLIPVFVHRKRTLRFILYSKLPSSTATCYYCNIFQKACQEKLFPDWISPALSPLHCIMLRFACQVLFFGIRGVRWLRCIENLLQVHHLWIPYEKRFFDWRKLIIPWAKALCQAENKLFPPTRLSSSPPVGNRTPCHLASGLLRLNWCQLSMISNVRQMITLLDSRALSSCLTTIFQVFSTPSKPSKNKAWEGIDIFLTGEKQDRFQKVCNRWKIKGLQR